MKPVLSMILPAAIVAGGVSLAPAAWAQAQEKCYGAALAGADDGVGGDAVAGASVLNYQGNAWIWVPRGECLTMALPVQPDGTPRRGALEPLERDRPTG